MQPQPEQPTEQHLLSTVAGMLMGTKITDWKAEINENKIRMDAAEKLRDAAEMILGYCLIDPTRSAITRNRIPRMLAAKRWRDAMTTEERAQHDLMEAHVKAEIDIMKQEDLTFSQMAEVRQAVII